MAFFNGIAVGQLIIPSKLQSHDQFAITLSAPKITKWFRWDGGSDTPKVPQKQTVIQKETVKPAFSPPPQATKTIVYTSVVRGLQSEETVVVTATQDIPQTVTAVASPSRSITPEKDSSSTEPVISTKVYYSTEYDVTTTTLPASTVKESVTASSSVEYYDDGMWHTSYAVKHYALPTPGVQAASTYSEPCDKRYVPAKPKWDRKQRRHPIEYSKAAGVVSPTSTTNVNQKQKRHPTEYSKAAGVASPTPVPEDTYFKMRSIPSDMKVENGNLTDIDQVNGKTG